MNMVLQYKELIKSCIIRSLLLIGSMVLIRHQSMIDLSGRDDLWTIFFSIVGVIYAITIAFLLVIVLEKFNAFSASISREINLIKNIRDFLIFIKSQPDLQKKTYESLLEYVRFWATVEWKSIKESKIKEGHHDSDTCPEFYEVMKCVTQLEPQSRSGQIALKEIISKIGEITTIRTERVNLSEQSVSPLLYFYLKFMGLMLTIPFILYDGENIYVQSAMVFAIVCAIRILYEIVRDLDNPLTGVWNVDTSELTQFLEKEKNKDLEKMFFEEFTTAT